MDPEKLDLHIERLVEVIQSLPRRLHAELAQNLVSGITMSQFIVLMSLKDRTVNVSEVAEEMCVSLSAVTALADRLHKAGFVVRRRDEQDRRLVWLALTGEGERIVSACQLARKKVLKKYFGQLREEDIDQLMKIYEKILVLINAESK
ncbi:MAG: putative HTH-type transcriptional regulator YusO [Pelotomaculum sp. PtaU1.Bin035]|nr:MAG: putative HTH-type transcriptional regulator YusO [Pelotomaculum sp. PtaU1.Bin035]